MTKSMIHASYPLIGTSSVITISVSQSEPDPESQYDDPRVECVIIAPEYKEQFFVYGIDQLQCVWLALRELRVRIIEFEKKTHMVCEYRYFQEFELD